MPMREGSAKLILVGQLQGIAPTCRLADTPTELDILLATCKED
jgi:hypothetical protein